MKITAIIIALVIWFNLGAQKTEWAITLTKQSSNVSTDHKVCTDKENNFYITANFTGTILFGSDIVLKSANSTGATDAFIAKIDPNGDKVLWGTQITGFGNIQAQNICTDQDMNVYVAGSFEDKTTFGGTTTIIPKGKTGFFIAKYNSGGEFQWVKHGGNYYSALSGTAGAKSVKTDDSGNIYVAAYVMGMYDEWVHNPDLPVEEQYLGKAYYENEDISTDHFYTGTQTLILKLSPSGELLWKKYCELFLLFNDMALDRDANIYLTGVMSATVMLEDRKMETRGLRDIVLLKMDPGGEYLWIKQFGAGEIAGSGNTATTPTDLEQGSYIDVDPDGNVYLSGIHYDGAKFDDITLNTEAKLGNLAVGTIFLAKIDKDGRVQWAKNADAKKTIATICGTVCDKQGNSYISAVIGLQKVSFDGHPAKGAFIAKFDKDGNVAWINDADKSDFWSSTKVEVTYPGGLAINENNDYLYTTGNATKKSTDSNYLTGTTTVTTESIIAVSKVASGN
ncbi:MAG: hypothetical protein ABIJ16_09580 [Bacteroidota bacterium]